MSRNDKIYYHLFHLNTYIFKSIISLLIIIQVNSILKSRCKHILFLERNQILLKIKERGKISIINSGFSPKPSSYYLKDDQNPKTLNGSTIDFTNSQNEVTLIFTRTITTCNSMFKGCSKITEIDLSNFNSNNVGNIDYMFDGCTSLKSIKFGNFKTSRLNIMEYVFRDCHSLETLDLSSFDTSQVTDFHYMFSGCSSLKYLDLSNFKTSSCICTFYMFDGCTSITSINLLSFDTSKVTFMDHMFYNCKNLVSLDLSSFDTTKVIRMQNMFSGCEKLEFVNFKKALKSTYYLNNYENMISNTAKNIVFCVDESKISIWNQLIGTNSCLKWISDCSNWRNFQKKILLNQNECVESCSNTTYPYEYLGKCYVACPNGTSYDNNNKC